MEPITLDHDIMLQVDFKDKDRAKRSGAIPNYEAGVFRGWKLPRGRDLRPVAEWVPINVQKEVGLIDENVQGLTLSQVLASVKATIEQQHASPIWIQAEILNISGSPHMYIELVDYDDSGREKAKARAMIWASQMQIVHNFVAATGVQLQAGVKIQFKAFIEYHERFGLGFRVMEIDPNFTMGEMEAKLHKIRTKLQEMGVIDNNRQQPQPFDFFKVAVIAPEKAAGLGDFMSQSDVLVSYGLCEFDFFPAVFQGDRAAASVCDAMDRVYGAIQEGNAYDALVIIRGGGDKAGLYAMNEMDIAVRVCSFPIPVMVGIGHERDNTILDELACVRLPTPSLVISHIAGTIVNNARQVQSDMMMIRKVAQGALHKARMDTERHHNSMKEIATAKLTQARHSVIQSEKEMRVVAKQQLVAARHNVKSLMQDLLYNDPRKIVQKGYTLVRNADGKVVGNASDVPSGENIEIEFRDGKVTAQSL